MSPSWTRLDVDIMSSSSVQRLLAMGAPGTAGFAVFIEGICWSARNLTDGMLPDWWAPTVPRAARALAALVEVGLFIEVSEPMRHGLPGDEEPALAHARWLVKDYDEYGVLRAEWEELTEKRRAAAQARWSKRRHLRGLP